MESRFSGLESANLRVMIILGTNNADDWKAIIVTHRFADGSFHNSYLLRGIISHAIIQILGSSLQRRNTLKPVGC